jgi:sugar phosphate isomerase/epimerase
MMVESFERMSRRRFVGMIGGAAAGAAIATSPFLGSTARGATTGHAATCTGYVPRPMLGTISWTCNATAVASAELWLQEMATIGYTYVEHAGGVLTYGDPQDSSLDGASPRLGMSAQQFRTALDNAGLKCLAGHNLLGWSAPYDVEAWKQAFEDAQVIGQWYAGITNATPTTYDDCKRYADGLHRAAQLGRSMGFKGSLFQHYDVGAFTPLTDRPDLRPIDVVMKYTKASEFHAELDTNHAMQQLGSVAAVIAEVRKFKGRILQFHMKDGLAPVAPNTAATELASSTEFGLGDWGRPDPNDPNGRPHAGFQDLISAIYATQPWNKVLLITESDTSGPTCVDYSKLSYDGLNGLSFARRC